MTSYGMNTQEGGAMCQVLDECAQTLATTHRGVGYLSRANHLQLVRRREQPSRRGRRLLHVAVLGRALPRGRDLGGVTCETE